MNHAANMILPTVSRLITAYCMINAYVWTDFLQVMAQSVHLGQEEIDVGLRYGGTGDNIPEEVGPSIIRLIANHQRTSLHHATLQDWTNLKAYKLLFRNFSKKEIRSFFYLVIKESRTRSLDPTDVACIFLQDVFNSSNAPRLKFLFSPRYAACFARAWADTRNRRSPIQAQESDSTCRTFV